MTKFKSIRKILIMFGCFVVSSCQPPAFTFALWLQSTVTQQTCGVNESRIKAAQVAESQKERGSVFGLLSPSQKHLFLHSFQITKDKQSSPEPVYEVIDVNSKCKKRIFMPRELSESDKLTLSEKQTVWLDDNRLLSVLQPISINTRKSPVLVETNMTSTFSKVIKRFAEGDFIESLDVVGDHIFILTAQRFSILELNSKREQLNNPLPNGSAIYSLEGGSSLHAFPKVQKAIVSLETDDPEIRRQGAPYQHFIFNYIENKMKPFPFPIGTDPHAYAFITSPSGNYVAVRRDYQDRQLKVLDMQSETVVFEEEDISDVRWLSDQQLIFQKQHSGLSNLVVFDLESKQNLSLTITDNLGTLDAVVEHQVIFSKEDPDAEQTNYFRMDISDPAKPQKPVKAGIIEKAPNAIKQIHGAFNNDSGSEIIEISFENRNALLYFWSSHHKKIEKLSLLTPY